MTTKVLMASAEQSHLYGTGSTIEWKGGYRHTFAYNGKRWYISAPTEAELKAKKRRKIADIDAAAAWQKAEAERAAGPAQVVALTVREWVKVWRESHVGVWSPNTDKNYGTYLDRYILPALGEFRLDELEPMVVRDAIRKIPATYTQTIVGPSSGKTRTVTRSFGETSRFHMWNVVTSFMGDAWQNPRRSGLNRNTLDGVKPPFAPSCKRPKAPWTPEQIEVFFRSCHAEYLTPAFALAAFGGLRESEILGLEWTDIDFDKGLVRLQRQMDRDHTIRDRLKSKKDEEARTIALPRPIVRMLDAYKSLKRRQQISAGHRWKGDRDLVITTYLGGTYGHRNLARELTRYAERAGLEATSLHGLRRACDSLMNMRGVAMATRQHFMGHSSSRTTEKYDYKYDPTILLAAESIGEALPWLEEIAAS
ncbi:MAG TPA: tyrosine-type recombinase/integrase [Candidatus Limnocylindrales bacterium]